MRGEWRGSTAWDPTASFRYDGRVLKPSSAGTYVSNGNGIFNFNSNCKEQPSMADGCGDPDRHFLRSKASKSGGGSNTSAIDSITVETQSLACSNISSESFTVATELEHEPNEDNQVLVHAEASEVGDNEPPNQKAAEKRAFSKWSFSAAQKRARRATFPLRAWKKEKYTRLHDERTSLLHKAENYELEHLDLRPLHEYNVHFGTTSARQESADPDSPVICEQQPSSEEISASTPAAWICPSYEEDLPKECNLLSLLNGTASDASTTATIDRGVVPDDSYNDVVKPLSSELVLIAAYSGKSSPMNLAMDMIRRLPRDIDDTTEIQHEILKRLAVEDGFDFVWVTQSNVVAASLQGLADTMKPNSWLLSIIFGEPSGERQTTLSRLGTFLRGNSMTGESNALVASFLDPSSEFDPSTFRSRSCGSVGTFVIQMRAVIE